jgi:1,4-dihydroxy-2-naphthoate octaprenyltransferase
MDTLQARFRDKATEILQTTPTILVALGRGPTFTIETCYCVGTGDEISCIVKPNPAIVEAVRDDAHVAFAVNQGFPKQMLQGTGRAFFLGGLDRHPHIREQVLAKTPDAAPFLTTIRNLGVLKIVPDHIAITDDANLGLGPRPVYIPEASRALADRRGRWLQATGWESWFLVLVPVLVAVLLALHAPVSVAWAWCLPVFIAALFFQVGTTMLVTYTESRRRVRRGALLGTSQVLVEGLLPARQVFWGGLLCLAGGVLLGLPMASERGMPVLLLGVVGVLSSLSYAGWPARVPSYVSDEVAVFLGLGPVATLGSWYVLTGVLGLTPAMLSLAIGLLAAALLHAARLPTLAADAKAGTRTAAAWLGWEGARRLYYLLTGIPYLLVLGLLLADMLPGWAWLTFLSAPLTGRGVLSVWQSAPEQLQDLAGLDTQTTYAYAAFGLSLGLGLLLGYLTW